MTEPRKTLLVDVEQGHWRLVEPGSVPEDALDGSGAEFSTLCTLAHLEVPRMASGGVLESLREVGLQPESQRIPWEWVCGESWAAELARFASKFFEDPRWNSEIAKITRTYLTVVEPKTNWYMSDNVMSPFRVNHESYRSVIEDKDEHAGVRSTVGSFNPISKNNDCAEILYSRNTVTGRLKVIEGPEILRVKREHRENILTSSHEDGQLWYLDYSSLEPRTLLELPPKQDILDFSPKTNDIYTELRESLGLSEKDITRKAMKLCVVQQMYGMSHTKLAQQLLEEGVRYPDDFMEMVSDVFKLNEMAKELNSVRDRFGGNYILNGLDRPIAVTYETTWSTLLNYYTQSTAVDLALLGFGQIINKINSVDGASKVFCPKAVLHDALILDVDSSVKHLVHKLAAVAEQVQLPNRDRVVRLPISADLL